MPDTPPIASITVYCGSSTWLDPDFHESARAVGNEIASRGLTLVYGGGNVGLMGEVAQAALQAGGRVVGVITERLAEKELGLDTCDELVVVDTMRERKRIMEDRGDAFLMLPGGLGTYEEFFEILVGRQLQEHDKPIGVVNAHGYFNPLRAMVEHGIEHRFIKPAVLELFVIDPDPHLVIEDLCQGGTVAIDDDRFLPMGDG